MGIKSKKVLFILLVCLISLPISSGFASDSLDGRKVEVYKRVIGPWLDKWFKDRALEIDLVNNVKIERELLGKGFSGFELVDGKALYTVDVVFLVNIVDTSARLKVWGLKEQQIVFWMDGVKVRDYFPFREGWRQQPSVVNSTGTIGI